MQDSKQQQWEYTVGFSFTTFNISKSTMTGRRGSLNITSSVTRENIDDEEVKQLCIIEVLRLKPKWNILMLDIESICPFKRPLNSISHD